jgi:undecaprenyl-diphosphatase
MTLSQLDGAAFVWVNTGWSNGLFDFVMPWITLLSEGGATWIWIVLIALLSRLQPGLPDKTKERNGVTARTVILSLLFLALIYGVNAGVYKGLKYLTVRPRPFVEQRQPVILRVSAATAEHLSKEGSFPSGHACNAFMTATLLAVLFRRPRIIFYALAALIALSRVYLGVHYPGDIIAGATLALLITRSMLFMRPFGARNSP